MPLVGGGGLGVEPALEPGSHRLDLQGLGLARQPGAPLQTQEVLAIDLGPQQAFQCLPIDGTLEPERHRLHRHMAVVVVPMVVMVMVVLRKLPLDARIVIGPVGMVVVRMVVVGMVVLSMAVLSVAVIATAVIALVVIATACICLVAVQAEQQGRRHLAPGHG